MLQGVGYAAEVCADVEVERSLEPPPEVHLRRARNP